MAHLVFTKKIALSPELLNNWLEPFAVTSHPPSLVSDLLGEQVFDWLTSKSDEDIRFGNLDIFYSSFSRSPGRPTRQHDRRATNLDCRTPAG
jgi:hypothetical protein